MGKGKKKQKALKEELKASGLKRLPKVECCVSKDRCGRCPIRMLKEGTLPEGYTVRKRKLVRAEPRPGTSGIAAPAAAKKKNKQKPLAA